MKAVAVAVFVVLVVAPFAALWVATHAEPSTETRRRMFDGCRVRDDARSMVDES